MTFFFTDVSIKLTIIPGTFTGSPIDIDIK